MSSLLKFLGTLKSVAVLLSPKSFFGSSSDDHLKRVEPDKQAAVSMYCRYLLSSSAASFYKQTQSVLLGSALQLNDSNGVAPDIKCVVEINLLEASQSAESKFLIEFLLLWVIYV